MKQALKQRGNRLMTPSFKKAILLSLTIILIIGTSQAEGQLWKKVKDRVKQTVENKVTQKSEDVTTNVVNKAENSIGKSENQQAEAAATTASGDNLAATAASRPSGMSDYKSYDFVPGDKIIFEPDLSKEPEAELPARFAIKSGNAEIQLFENEKILHMDAGGNVALAPLMSNETYLPEQFTVEFDMTYENKDDYFRHTTDFAVEFRKSDDNNYKSYPLYGFKLVTGSQCLWGTGSVIHLSDEIAKSLTLPNVWHHVAIYIRGNIGKVYLDQNRIAASNTMPVGAQKVNLRADGMYGIKIKNFRLAAGGDDKYKKIITDGKFITHGILFDVNKSTIKAESMGTLNEVTKLLKEHADLKFEIDGHTDSDGGDAANLQLSQSRAEAVKAKLVSMGISAERLTTKGFGASKPIDKNDTAEGKANNRRVEFIKM